MNVEDLPIYLTTRSAWKAIKKDAHSIGYVSKLVLSDDMCIYALKGGLQMAIHRIPEYAQTKRVCKYYICHSTWKVLTSLPVHIMDYNMYMYAIKHRYNLGSVPEEFVDQTMCDFALTVNLRNIQDVPMKFMKIKDCKKVFESEYKKVVHHAKNGDEYTNMLGEETLKRMLKFLRIVSSSKLEDKDHNEQCSICLDQILSSEKIKTSCGHIFCIDEITEWLTQKNTMNKCPVCRQLMDHTKEYYLYTDVAYKNLYLSISGY